MLSSRNATVSLVRAKYGFVGENCLLVNGCPVAALLAFEIPLFLRRQTKDQFSNLMNRQGPHERNGSRAQWDAATSSIRTRDHRSAIAINTAVAVWKKTRIMHEPVKATVVMPLACWRHAGLVVTLVTAAP